MKYLQGLARKDEGCVLCVKHQEQDDRGNLILHRGTHAFVLMNLYPYNNGHLMVVPYRHTAQMGDLDGAAVQEIWQLAERSVAALRTAFQAEGFNLGLNLGRVAGAGIDQHLHLHVVPRWNGDTNFMPVVGETKVISQGLADAYNALLPHFQGRA
jgi:ATP adenylyltransferase